MSWSHEVNFTNFALKSQHIFLATLDQKPSGGHIPRAQHVAVPEDQSYEVDGRRRSDWSHWSAKDVEANEANHPGSEVGGWWIYHHIFYIFYIYNWIHQTHGESHIQQFEDRSTWTAWVAFRWFKWNWTWKTDGRRPRSSCQFWLQQFERSHRGYGFGWGFLGVLRWMLVAFKPSVYPRHQYISSYMWRLEEMVIYIDMFFQAFLAMICAIHIWKNKKTSKGASPKQTNIKQTNPQFHGHHLGTLWILVMIPGDALPWVLSCPTRSWRSWMSISGAALVIQWLGTKGENGKPQTSEGNPPKNLAFAKGRDEGCF